MRVVVIGGGVIGLSTAYYLARQRVQVVLIDRARAPASGASHANGGLLTPSMADPWNTPGVAWRLMRWLGRGDAPVLLRPRVLPGLLRWGYRFLRESAPSRYRVNTLKNLRLSLYSLAAMREFRLAIGLQYDAATNGTIKLFRSPARLEQARELAQSLAKHGLDFRVHDARATVELEPALEPISRSISGSLRFPADETGDARLYCEGLARLLPSLGCELRFDTTVDGWELGIRGKRIVAVKTAAEPLRADAFVLAAGAMTAALARQLKFSVPIAPAKGYSISVPMHQWTSVPACGVVDDDLHAALTPIGSTLRVAGTAEFAGFDRSVQPDRISNLLSLLNAVYPDRPVPRSMESLRAWAGLRPMSADGVPILGATPIHNLFVNSGHGHLGWTMAAGSARAVASIVVGERPDIDLADYSLSRFSSHA